LKLKTSRITKTVDEVKDHEDFALSLRIIEIEDEKEAEKVRRVLKVALLKYGGQTFVDETEK
jgi:hypothetical protein